MSTEPGTATAEQPAADAPQHDTDAEQGATTAPGAAPGQDATTGQPGEHSPAPLTSLSSLFGDSFEGGAACTADGTCD